MKYGFIGAGNMGGAIAKALRNSTAQIALSDRSGKAKTLAESLGVAYWSNREIAENCERIFLGVKPYLMKDMLSTIAPVLAERKPLIITMAAGLEIQQIRDFIGVDLPIIRIMPNTPTAVSKGVIQYCHNSLVTEDLLEDWLRDMAPCGLLDELEERLIDAASSISGSGPAYMYQFLDALADGAVACGIPRAKAMEYAAMPMAGSAEMYLQTKPHPGALKDAVCSPLGSTIQGVRALEDTGFRGAVIECVLATYARNKEMGK